MTETDEQLQFRRELAQLASETAKWMDGTTEPIRRLFEHCDMVFGVWPDASEPCGVAYNVLKGGKLLLQSIADQKKLPAHCRGAIPFECYEQAIAAKELFGERDFDA